MSVSLNFTPIILLVAIATLLPIWLIWRKDFVVLCEIQWVVEFHFSAEEVNHVDEVLDVAVASGASFGKLDFAIDAF